MVEKRYETAAETFTDLQVKCTFDDGLILITGEFDADPRLRRTSRER